MSATPVTELTPSGGPSPLARYLAKLEKQGGEKAVAEFAERAGSSVRYLRVVARGDKAPGPRVMKGIVAASGNRVTYKHLVESSPGLDAPSRAGHSTILASRKGKGQGKTKAAA